jgi:hypothetical protein
MRKDRQKEGRTRVNLKEGRTRVNINANTLKWGHKKKLLCQHNNATQNSRHRSIFFYTIELELGVKVISQHAK